MAFLSSAFRCLDQAHFRDLHRYRQPRLAQPLAGKDQRRGQVSSRCGVIPRLAASPPVSITGTRRGIARFINERGESWNVRGLAQAHENADGKRSEFRYDAPGNQTALALKGRVFRPALQSVSLLRPGQRTFYAAGSDRTGGWD